METCVFIELKWSICKERELFILLDTGADVPVVNSKKLICAAEFELQQNVRLKSENGSIMEKHGVVKTDIVEGSILILL
jgi:hypothetical protein